MVTFWEADAVFRLDGAVLDVKMSSFETGLIEGE